MDPDVQEVEDDPSRRRRRRRRSSSRESEPRESVLANVDLVSVTRQLAGLAVFGALFLFIMVAPIPMGANRDWAWAPMVVFVGVLAVLCATGIGGQEGFRISAAETTPLLLLTLFFIMFVALVTLQMTGLSPTGVTERYYADAGKLLGQTLEPLGTLSVDGTRDALLRCLACGLLFLIGRGLFHDQQWAKLLLLVFIASAAVVMTYAVFMAVTKGSCYVGSYLKKEGAYMVNEKCLMSGTFVGSNNFGCFCGMAVLASVGFMFAPRRSRRYDIDDEPGDGSNPFAEWLTGRRVGMLALTLYFTGGLLLSASRASVIATVIALFTMIYLLRRGRARVPFGLMVIISVVIGVGLLVLAGGVFLTKASNLFTVSTLSRVVIWRASIDAFMQAPWFGWGLGSYNDIYAVHQPISIVLPNDKAHSTPLEFLVEVGIVGAIPAFMVCLMPWSVTFMGGLRQRRERELPAIAFAIAAVPIIHSMVDFSLQIPSIAFVTSIFMGVGWAHAFRVAPPRPSRSFANEA
jgi:hypothetical protein